MSIRGHHTHSNSNDQKQWRQFNFFDVQQVKDPNDPTKPPAIFLEEDPPIIKIWDLDKQDKSKGTPTCQRTIKVNHGGKPFPVSALAVLENLGQIAVGLANGVVVLIKGDLYRDRYTRQRIIHESDEPITGLGFKEHNKTVILFIVTTSKVLTYVTTSRSPITIIDEQGAALGCAVMSDTTHEMVVAKDEAIYFYEPDGRGPCFAYE
ncbi:6147_t:CDS:2, partial [Cetraspora pellucida]